MNDERGRERKREGERERGRGILIKMAVWRPSWLLEEEGETIGVCMFTVIICPVIHLELGSMTSRLEETA